MKLEKQVVSLDIAKRLKELGVKQNSLFYWYDEKIIIYSGVALQGTKDYSAFTVAELGEMLPDDFVSSGNCCWSESNTIKPPLQEGATEADARGKMLVYLLEKGLIKVDEAELKALET